MTKKINLDIKQVLPRILPPIKESELKEKDIYYTQFGDFLLSFYIPICSSPHNQRVAQRAGHPRNDSECQG